MKALNVVVELAILSCLAAVPIAHSQIVISGNENKIDLASGAALGVAEPAPDSITVLDFAKFPPKETTIDNVPNTVIGPPSNIAITPDGTLALIANSAKPDPADPTTTVPLNQIHLLDLTVNPPKIIGDVAAGSQPSGMSIAPDGKLALVANRAAGSVSVLRIAGKKVTAFDEVKLAEPAASVSDVAISPDGKRALASLQKAGVLAELKIAGEKVEPTGRKFSVYGQPYRVVISPDGQYAFTAGTGYSTNGVDADALTLIGLQFNPPRTIQHLTIGAGPESLEISPDGKLVVVGTMDGSNLGPGNPNRSDAGGLYVYRRAREGFDFSQHLKTGRIPEGVAFTSDGKYFVVQCHPDRELRIYRVSGTKLNDTGERVKVPGYPSSLRAAR